MPLDKASFARKFCWATVKPRAIPNSSYEYMGDGLFRVLFVAAIEKEFGGMTAHDMHVLTGQYLSNPALANIARYFDLFDLMQDCPVENKDAPTIGMLADALEMWLGVMYTEDMRLVGSSKRLSDWVERVFSSRVMPHLALDIEAKRATTEHRGLQLPPRPEYPSEPAWLYAQVESWFPPPLVSSLHLLEKWEHLETECAVILDWHLFGESVISAVVCTKGARFPADEQDGTSPPETLIPGRVPKRGAWFGMTVSTVRRCVAVASDHWLNSGRCTLGECPNSRHEYQTAPLASTGRSHALD
jgi:hypothetical protein